jgi:hypothetical protein
MSVWCPTSFTRVLDLLRLSSFLGCVFAATLKVVLPAVTVIVFPKILPISAWVFSPPS